MMEVKSLSRSTTPAVHCHVLPSWWPLLPRYQVSPSQTLLCQFRPVGLKGVGCFLCIGRIFPVNLFLYFVFLEIEYHCVSCDIHKFFHFYIFPFLMFMLLTKSWYWLLMDPLGHLSAHQETVASKSELEHESLRFLMSLNLSVSEMDSLPIKGMLDICYQLYYFCFNIFC